MHRSERVERRGLGRRQRHIVYAFAEALLSDADGSGRATAPDGAWLQSVVDDFDKLVGAGSPDTRRGLGALLFAVEALPAVMLGSLKRMSQLPLAERVAYLDALECSRVGLVATLLVAFKIPLTMIAYDQGDALAMSGYDRATLSTPRGEAAIAEPTGSLLRARGGRAA